MLLNRTITRKLLENIVHETFSQFGILSSSSLLDSLKLLGFYYATNAGISINIEDLKTPDQKEQCLKNAKNEVLEVSYKWQQGLVSDTERFQSIIDSWNIATESLKNRVIEYYRNFDPTNNLYIMSFSGARGNMSQVRQLVGMRGLMSDQEGKIIDLPIQTNFREGLSSIDYIISSYGARKGIVDTALKTADSGYLTRRLIYIAQDLVIRQEDFKNK
jgi:DNA-directed RNA polymerase subunit beta'